MSLLAAIVLLPLVLGTTLSLWCGRANTPGRRAGAALIAGAMALGALGLLLSQAPAVFAGEVIRTQAEWVPAIGLDADFRLDGLGLMFAMLISGIGVLIVTYAAFYLHKDDPAGKFFSQLMLFMAAMLGIALSDNVLLLVVFWELTSISSFLLVGYWGSHPKKGADARAGARMALAVTGGGGLVMLAGMVLLGQIAGTYSISELLTMGPQIQADPRYPLVLVLVLIGCFTKSAQLPFHFWLPEAMAAPTPVSAYLHSATMVKAGLFLMMRLYPVLGGSGLFEGIVATIGLLTMVFAASVAIFKHDLKGLLAYSTVSHLGLVTFLIGLATPMSMVVAVFHILNHAAFKAALFMSAGIVDHETGTRDMRKLGGLMAMLPIVGTLATIAAAAMAGVPPFNGFISKEMMLDEALKAGERMWGGFGWAVPVLATLGGLASMAYSLRLVHDVFFNGPPRDLPVAHPHEPPWGMKAPVLLLVIVCIAVGLMPMTIAGPLVNLAASAVLGAPAPGFSLALWHGINLPLAMSGIAVAGGAALYFTLAAGRKLHRHEPGPVSGKGIFTALTDGLFGAAGRFTVRLENGSLQRYAGWMVALALVLGAWPFFGGPVPGTGERALLPATPLALVLWVLLGIVCVALVLGHHLRFRAVVLTGVVGLVTALTFLGFSAPDLALTQLSVEVVSTVLLLMGLALLPQTTPRESSAGRKARDAVLALGGGAGIAWLAWVVMTRDHDSIAWYFLANSLPQGGGTNAVNVILVDFRGYDTFGEITVLGIAGVGVLALMDRFRVRRPTTDPDGRAWTFPAVPLMLRQAAKVVLPLALVVSVYIFWRGHNLPGGGFIAGLVTAVALVLQYLALGQSQADALLHAAGGRRYVKWVGTGLGIALLTGIGSFVFGHPFLSSAFGHPIVPVLGELPLATAALFDLGVYITVVGATLLTLSVLGAASKEGARA
ncbi:monovalent cation/H+ antiporter subunit A [Rubrivivax albus]|uniref:Monovalent cation/H+ antiporter subunit A n=1 Tax=Rubrivivax albus TaxID=2499835 RepID=A0A3S2TKV4_9BURK|nr:monovalent cation/H+ antiporter subunit A [Rubrivivax albus]RVT50104.1 monovalent cation/H+ antiporter subunit A [Rubrivivax albus]